jgi:hypothetical protein
MPVKSSKRGKSSSSKKTSSSRRNLPYDVKIMMCVRDPFVKNSKPTWRTLPGMADLEIELIKQWYNRFEMEKLIKVLIVHGIQVCVKANYGGKLPSWFSRNVNVSNSSKKVDDYFRMAQHIVAAMKLGGNNMAGLMLKQTKNSFKPISSKDFVTYSVVKARSAFSPGMFPTVWDMLDMKESNVTSTPNTTPGDNFGADTYCTEVFQTLREVIGDVLKGNYLAILNKYSEKGSSFTPTDLSDSLSVAASEASAATQRVIENAGSEVDVVGDAEPDLIDLNSEVVMMPSGSSEAGGLDLVGKKERSLTDLFVQPRWQGVGNNPGIPGESKLGRFGSAWSATTTPMVGFVKPFNISMAESYTGMTNKAYKRHINSATGTPDGKSRPLYKANDWYGSSKLGASLNPMARFGLNRKLNMIKENKSAKNRRKTSKSAKKNASFGPKSRTAKKSATKKRTAKKSATKKRTAKVDVR